MRFSVLPLFCLLAGQVSAADGSSENVVTADDIVISAEEVKLELAEFSEEEARELLSDPSQAEVLIRKLLRMETVENRAANAELEEDPHVAWKLRKARAAVLEGALLRRFVAERGLPDFEKLALETYAMDRERFYEPRRIKISQIYLRANEAEKPVAREKAAKLVAELKDGGDFAELAKENSDGPHAAEGGSLPDWLVEDSKRLGTNDVLAAAFALDEVGATSDVLETPYGLHIVRLEKEIPGRQLDFEDVKGNIVMSITTDYERRVQQEFRASLQPSGANIDPTLYQRLLREAAGMEVNEPG